mgnify:CR=1 FL=1
MSANISEKFSNPKYNYDILDYNPKFTYNFLD